MTARHHDRLDRVGLDLVNDDVEDCHHDGLRGRRGERVDDRGIELASAPKYGTMIANAVRANWLTSCEKTGTGAESGQKRSQADHEADEDPEPARNVNPLEAPRK